MKRDYAADEAARIQAQSVDEWLEEYETGVKVIPKGEDMSRTTNSDYAYFQAFRVMKKNGDPVTSPTGKSAFLRVVLGKDETKEVWVPKSLMKVKMSDDPKSKVRQFAGEEPMKVAIQQWFVEKEIYAA